MSDDPNSLIMTPTDLSGKQTLTATMERMHAGGENFSVVMVDINQLARLNESAGRDQGDDIMATATSLLSEFAGSNYPLVHLGDDDFALLLPNTDRMKAMIAGTRIQGKAVMSSKETGDWKLLFNVGVASSDEGDPDAVLVKAEERLLKQMARLNGDVPDTVTLKADGKGTRTDP